MIPGTNRYCFTRDNIVATQFDPRVDEALKQEFMDELLVMRSALLVQRIIVSSLMAF